MCHENENSERVNEFGQYEYKVQEKVTTKRIEHDLQQRYADDLWIFLLMIPCIAVFDGLFVWLVSDYLKDGKDSLFAIITLGVPGIACAILTFFAVGGSIYKLYMMIFGCKRFSVAIDHCKGVKTVVKRRLRVIIDQYLMFNKYGKIQLPGHEYYTWSENHRMFVNDVEQSSHIGDRFFLIMRGKKIVYFYNDRMFDLSETLKSVRLIGENPAAPTLNGESTDDSADSNGEEKIFH